VLRSRPLAAITLAASLVAMTATPAHAGYQTIKRSFENMLFAPLDLLLSPVMAAKTEYNHLTTIEDSPGVRYFYAVPGFFWLTGVQAGAAMLRGVTGGLELPIGIAVLPFPDLDTEPLFDPAARQSGLVDVETPPLHVKFGLDYATLPE
jgi:hypothetical protein